MSLAPPPGSGMTSQRTRDRMVARLREFGVADDAVLEAMRAVPRHLFVDEALASRAYEDSALPKNYKKILQLGLGEAVLHTYAETEWRNPEAMNENATKYGVTNRRWTDDELAAFEKAWDEVLAEEIAKDATFKKVADSYLAFRKKYKAWGDAQAMKPTYLK